MEIDGETTSFGRKGGASSVQHGPHRSQFLICLVQLLFFGFCKSGKQAVFPFLERIDFAQQLNQRHPEISAAPSDVISCPGFYRSECPGRFLLLTRPAVWCYGGPPYSVPQFIRTVGQAESGEDLESPRGHPCSAPVLPPGAWLPISGVVCSIPPEWPAAPGTLSIHQRKRVDHD